MPGVSYAQSQYAAFTCTNIEAALMGIQSTAQFVDNYHQIIGKDFIKKSCTICFLRGRSAKDQLPNLPIFLWTRKFSFNETRYKARHSYEPLRNEFLLTLSETCSWIVVWDYQRNTGETLCVVNLLALTLFSFCLSHLRRAIRCETHAWIPTRETDCVSRVYTGNISRDIDFLTPTRHDRKQQNLRYCARTTRDT